MRYWLNGKEFASNRSDLLSDTNIEIETTTRFTNMLEGPMKIIMTINQFP